MDDGTNFDGKIKVAAKIIDHISSGLYESPAACLKELINNSFDADATRVDVFVKPDANQIIIADNGIGLNKKEFQQHFDSISESYKRSSSDKTKSGRPKIGKIGIGFIAANEICDVMEIESTKENSTDLLKVKIDFGEMRKAPEERIIENSKEVTKGDYHGTIDKAAKKDHYTFIILNNIRGEAKQILDGVGVSPYTSGKKSIYGLSPKSIKKILLSEPKSWKDFDSYSENMLTLALNVPVKYYDDWYGNHNHQYLKELTERAAKWNFTVFVDGTELRKPIVFPKGNPSIFREFNFSGNSVNARGYFYAQHGIINPAELRGLLIRVREAGVGSYDGSFLKFSPTTASLFQKWISAEIYASDDLEDAMIIDRKTFRITHQAYAELQIAIHKFLSEFINQIRNEIYEKQGEIRKEIQAQHLETSIFNIIKDANFPSDLEADLLMNIKQIWEGSESNSSVQKKILKKYAIDEIYEMIVDIGKENLTPKIFNQIIIQLTKRLRG